MKLFLPMVIYLLLQTSDIVSLHGDVCPNVQRIPKIQLSLDGVSEAKSTSISLDVYSASFTNCTNVYPLKIIRPLNRFPTDNDQYLEDLLENLKN